MTDVPVPAPGNASFVGALVSVGIAVVVGLGCYLMRVPDVVTSAVTPAAGTLSATIAYRLDRRRRDTERDLARLRAGELRRPVALVAALLGFAIFLWDSILGLIFGQELLEGSIALGIATIALLTAGAFGMSIYASHYLGDRPYLWTAIAIAGMVVVRVIVLVTFLTIADATELIPGFLSGMAVFVIVLGAALVGTYVGRRRQPQFVAAKAERLAATVAARPGAGASPAIASAGSPTGFAHPVAPVDPPPPDPRQRRLE